MKRKQLLHRIFSLGMILSLLSGCGQTPPENGSTASAQIVQDTEIGSTASEQTIQDTEMSAQSEQTETQEEIVMDYSEVFKNLELQKNYKGMLDANPIMTQRFGADPYAMEYNGRLYIYMTADAFEYDANGELIDNTYSKIQSINVVSTEDMVNFTDHGSIQVAGTNGGSKWARNSWAPAAAWKNIDGKDKFFLYFADGGGGIGVLTADSPVGPFTDPIGKGLIRRDMPNCGNVLWLFDPAVLVDDDGRAYIYFGGGVPQDRISDPGTGRVMELGPDMISVVGEAKAIDIPYLFEDSGIHKFNNRYYYTYCTNWQVDQAGTDKYGFHNADIAVLESDSPMGPFVYKETILENPGKYFGLYGNNHHCVFNYKDAWYITYHTRALEKAMKIEKGYRATNITAFTMGEDGTIGKIPQNLKGTEQLQAFDPYNNVSAATIAVEGGIETIPADAACEACGSGNMALNIVNEGSFVKVAGVDFGSEGAKKFTASVKNASGSEGVIAIRIDRVKGETVGYLPINATSADYSEITVDLDTTVTGQHDLYFVFAGKDYQVSTWCFE